LPRIVQLTPPGRGAIATLLVEGPNAAMLVGAHFRPAGGKPLDQYPLRQLIFGRFSVGSHPYEEVVVCRRTEQSVEVHCHGGHVAVTRIRKMLVEKGCRAVSWQQWVAGQHHDSLAASARTSLAHARTERTAAVLLDQYHGALRRAAEAIQHSLQSGDTASALQGLRALLARAQTGRHLTQPWRVVLAGLPNVGKSSLINALVGYQRAIVHPTAGTTRDVVSAATAIDGWPLELSDTAGLGEAKHPLELAAFELARRQLASADLVLLIFDSSRPWTAQDQTLLDSRPDGLVIHNKCDLPAYADPQRPDGLSTSALTGLGIEQLVLAIAGRLVPDPPTPGAAVPFTSDQIDHLQAAAFAASQGDVSSALGALGHLLR